jgi:hypothetical protein
VTTVAITPAGDNNVVYTVEGETQTFHVLQTPVVMLPGYSDIIIIIYITVPVTTVAITPAGDNNVVYTVEGETQTFHVLQTPVVLLPGYSGIMIIIYITVR